jgi:hypothetical protein
MVSAHFEDFRWSRSYAAPSLQLPRSQVRRQDEVPVSAMCGFVEAVAPGLAGAWSRLGASGLGVRPNLKCTALFEQ